MLMKLILNFDKPILPEVVSYDHQYMVYSGILNALSSINSGLADKLHCQDKGPEFVMSQLLGGGRKTFDNNGMIADRFVLLIASRKIEILSEIKKGIEKMGQLKAGPLILPYHSGEIVQINPPGQTPELVTKSPVVLKVDGRFIRQGDEGFIDELKASIIRKYQAITGQDNASIRFLRILDSKSKLCRVGSAKIPCTHMRFVIDTDPEVVKIMMTDGLGSKTQLGFGFIEGV